MHNKKKYQARPDKSAKMKLKLLVDSKSSKVLFAEAHKEFVDFLLSLLALPLGTVTRLLKRKEGTGGCLGVLYNSIESLNDSYIQPDLSKEVVLCPKLALQLANNYVPLLRREGVAYALRKLYRCFKCKSSKLSENPLTSCPSCLYIMNDELAFLNPSATANYGDTKLYVCGHCRSKYITASPQSCPSCSKLMNIEVTYLIPSSAGTEKGVVTYMVMDDLAVKPMSTISSICLLNTFNIKDVGVLEEKIVSLGMVEGLKLLRASLHSKNVLTDVFLRKTEA